MKTTLVNENTFNLKSTITDDWGNFHRVVLDLEAVASAKDWKLGLDLPEGYKIDQIYGAELTQTGNKVYLNGESYNKTLNKGGKTEIVLIIDEGSLSNADPIKPDFIFANSNNSNKNPIVDTPVQSASTLDVDGNVTADWDGGYKLELDLKAEANAKDWKVDFNLPYEVRAAYGVDLVDNGSGNYTISGQNDQASLTKGQSIKPVLIIDDAGQEALVPEFADSSSPVVAEKTVSQPLAKKSAVAAEPQGSEPAIAPQPAVQKPAAKLGVSPEIIEDWDGGYKFEIGLEAEGNAKDWQVDFKLPYTISAAYGVDLVDNGNGNYTISGQNDQASLTKGQSIKPVFIVEDNGQKALAPEFDADLVNIEAAPAPAVQNAPAQKSQPVNNSNPVNIPDSEGQAVGQRGQFAYGEALQKNFLFLEANRSGDLGPDNRVEWRSDSTLNDGSTVGRDLEGGYFDAGDHVKFGQPMAASINMLAWGGVEYKEAYQQSGQLDELLDAVKWGTDYFLKAHETSGGKTSKLWVQVGEGGKNNDHGYWGSPESVEANTRRNAFAIDPANPGSDVAASTSSAMAAASMLFRGVDNAYADKLLNNAKQLFEFAETYKGKYSDSVPQASPFYTSWSGYGDELASGAAWLAKATGEKSYLNKAESLFKSEVGGLGDWSWAVDNHSYGAAVILAQESNDNFFKGQVEGWLNKWINGGGNIKYTQGGFAHRAEWGSVPVTSSAAYLAQLYNDTVKEDARYSKFANKQVDYILGDNPANLSYMVGFGDKYPVRTHHRGSAGSQGNDGGSTPNDNILFGAVVGGPDAPDDFSHNDRRNDWVTNEVGTSYNAPFASALIQQFDNLGGDALSMAELDALPGIDANGVGF